MKLHSIIDKVRNRRALAVLVILGVSLVAGIAFARPTASLRPVQSGDVVPTPPVVVLRATPDGFDFDNLTLAAGQYIVAVHNSSGLDTPLTVVVTEAQLGTIGTEQVEPGADYTFSATLLAGSYAFSETGHPTWVAHVTVTP